VQSDPRRPLALTQGAYFVATGIWPLVHMPSFLRVTGPKHDLWLVRTVGALIAVAGAAILAAGQRGRVTAEMEFLAAGTAATLGMVDAIYASQRRIPPIYMLDGAAEAALVTLWLGLHRAARQSETTRADLQRYASR